MNERIEGIIRRIKGEPETTSTPNNEEVTVEDEIYLDWAKEAIQKAFQTGETVFVSKPEEPEEKKD